MEEGCSLTTLITLKTLKQLFQLEFMPNEYKIFLLESIVLSAIFTACCSSGSNGFH